MGSLHSLCVTRVTLELTAGARLDWMQGVAQSYVAYHHGWCTHLDLDKDAPEPRLVQPWAKVKPSLSPRSAGCTTITNGEPLALSGYAIAARQRPPHPLINASAAGPPPELRLRTPYLSTAFLPWSAYTVT